MVFNVFNKQFGNLKRVKHIVAVLTKHGFGYLIGELDPKRYIFFNKRLELGKLKNQNKSVPVRLRLVFEELGPTFIKFGQLLSTRPDILSEEFIIELIRLQDNIPSFGYEQVKKQIEKELGKPINQIFPYFNKIPIASASIGQVHEARLNNGEKVAVKIQRVNIEKIINEDLDILTFFAELSDKYMSDFKVYNPKGFVEEFKRTIEKELNYKIEANNISKFHQNFKDSKTIVVPEVYPKYSTKRVLTMSFVEGIKVGELQKIKKKWINKKTIAKNGINAFFKQILIDGFFHADPHPGNMFILKNNVIAFLDFGMMGHVNKELMQKLTNLFTAAVDKDVDRVAEVFISLSLVDSEVDMESFKVDISDIIDEYYGASLEQIEIGKVINRVVNIGGKYNIILPRNFVLLVKALVTIEGIGRELDPEFNIIEASTPLVREITRKKINPAYMTNNFIESLIKTKDSIFVLPQKINSVLSKLQSGKLKTKIDQEEFKELESRIDDSSNKISISLVIAAIIISSTMILQIDKGLHIFGISIFALIGFLIAVFLGAWLISSRIIFKLFG